MTLISYLLIFLVATTTIGRATTPKLEPVAFTQASFALKESLFEKDRSKWTSLGYSATKVHNFVRNGDPTLFENVRIPVYSAVWQKNPNIITSLAILNLNGSELDAANSVYDKAGFRVASYSGMSHGGEARYSVVYLKERTQLPARRYRKSDFFTFLQKVQEARNDGYSPVEVNGWSHHGTTYFSHVWTKDGRDFHTTVEETANQWELTHTAQRNLGRSLRDLCVYHNANGDLRYAGVWVDDPAISDHYRNMSFDLPDPGELITTEYDFGSLIAQRLDNYVFTDVSGFEDPNGLYSRGSYLVHRLATKDTMISNQSFTPNDVSGIQTQINDIANSQVGFTAHLGFYIQDLQNGNYIAYNAHEPVYISSTRKLILASLMVRDDANQSESVTITPELFRDHDSGSRFQKSDVGSTVTREEMLYRMLRFSDNTAADFIWDFVGGQSAMMNLMHNTVGTLNCGEFTSKCQQTRAFRSYEPDLRWFDPQLINVNINTIPCHLLSDFINADNNDPEISNHIVEPPNDLQWIGTDTASQTWLLKHQKKLKSSATIDAGARHHFATLRQSMTPQAFGKFLWTLGREKIIDDTGLAYIFNEDSGETDANGNPDPLIPRKMTRSLNLNAFTTPNPPLDLYDDYRSKNGATYKNRTWVGITFDDGPVGDIIQPKYSFVVLTEKIEPGTFTGTNGDMNNLIDASTSTLIWRCIRFLNTLPDPPAPNFPNWAACFPAIQNPTGGANPEGDFDRDGYLNLMEWFLGTNPTLPPSLDPRKHSYPVFVKNEGYGYTYRYRVAPELIDDLDSIFSHSVQSSNDLNRWIDYKPEVSMEGTDTFEFRYDRPSRHRSLFLRLQIKEM